MKGALYYILASLACTIVFVCFFATGVGVLFLSIFWNAVIVKMWKAITKLGEEEKQSCEF